MRRYARTFDLLKKGPMVTNKESKEKVNNGRAEISRDVKNSSITCVYDVKHLYGFPSA